MLVSDPRLAFQHDSQKADLLDEAKTSTWLVALLHDLVQRSPKRILLTAVYSDHSWDGPSIHGHHPDSAPGMALDFWNADWALTNNKGILEILKVLPQCPYLWTVGLGGASQAYLNIVPWPKDYRFILFEDNHQDHVHVQAGNTFGEGLR